MKNISSLVIHTVKLKHSDNHSVGLCGRTLVLYGISRSGLNLHGFSIREYSPKFQMDGGPPVPIGTASSLEMHLLFIWW